MAYLAIQGDSKRCFDILKLLSSLGGINHDNYEFNHNCNYYFIKKNNEISLIIDDDETSFLFKKMTIYDFEKQHPFKLGDFVYIPDYESPVKIVEMNWNGYTIIYSTYVDGNIEYFSTEELKEWNSNEINENKIILNKTNKLYPEINLNNQSIENKTKLIFDENHEIKEENGEWFIVKKEFYLPKSYEEACDVLGISKIDIFFDTHFANIDVNLENLYKLIICRNAYWHFHNNWKPNWENNDECKYCIYISGNKSETGTTYIANKCLVFPTMKMRDTFYENFKDLIENCKELL